MAAVNSTMLPLGTPAPPFALPDAVSGRTVSLADSKDSRALLVMFICNHCPFVKLIQPELARLGKDYQDKGVAAVAINSNDIAKYPDDSPEKMREDAQRLGCNIKWRPSNEPEYFKS